MKPLIGIALLAGAALAADIHPLDVKPGMWESTTTVQMSGAPQIPAEVLAKMTPEQRSLIEARMKARESQMAKPTVTKHCITAEDLAKPLNFGESRATCKRTIVTSSSSKQEVQMECESGAIKSNGTVRIEAIDSEHVKIASHITSGAAPRTMVIDANGTGKWLGSSCAPDSGK